MNISALILAAGKGKRIGKPKLMLELDGKSFLSIITDNLKLAGIENIFCVVSGETIDEAKKYVPHIKYIINPAPENGMIYSVRLGLKEIGACDGVLIIPVDHPFVKANTLKKIIEAYGNNIDCIIKPVYENISGHPIIIPPELSEQILNSGLQKTLDVIIKESKIKKYMLNTKDSGVVKNINTLSDLNEQ